MNPIVITGTSTDVGKTIVTAALAATLRSSDIDVAVCKPVQTGVNVGEPGDLATISALVGQLPTLECARYPDPLAPETAARLSGLPPVVASEMLSSIVDFGDGHDQLLIEGAGGVLVRLASDLTILDVAAGIGASLIVVVQPGLGALNHAELTVAAARSAAVSVAGLVIGSWPRVPDLAARTNRDDLPRLTGVPIIGAIPEGVGPDGAAPQGVHPAATGDFAAAAADWFVPDLLSRLNISDRNPQLSSPENGAPHPATRRRAPSDQGVPA